MSEFEISYDRKLGELVYTDPRHANPTKGPRFIILKKGKKHRTYLMSGRLLNSGSLEFAIKDAHAYVMEKPDGTPL